MTLSNIKRNAMIGLSLTICAIVTFFFFREVDGAELMFNLAAGGGAFFLLFRVFLPLAFTAMAKVSPGEMTENMDRHPLGKFFIIRG